MTRFGLNQTPGEKCAARGRNTATGLQAYSVIFYNGMTRVLVLAERESFTFQVVAPDVEVEMDFANAQEVREALAQFEGKRVLEVDFDVPNSVRITPLASQRAKK